MLINIVDNIADISERMEGTLQWSGMGKAALIVNSIINWTLLL